MKRCSRLTNSFFIVECNRHLGATKSVGTHNLAVLARLAQLGIGSLDRFDEA